MFSDQTWVNLLMKNISGNQDLVISLIDIINVPTVFV